MSETKTFACPSCGAALTTNGAQTEIKCQFCGNTVIVPPELRTPRAPDDDDSDDESDTDLGEIVQPNLKPIMTFITGIVGVSVLAPLVITVVTFVIIGVVMLAVFGLVVPLATGAFRSAPNAPIFATATRDARAVSAPTATRTATPAAATATATPTPFSKILFQDTFTDPASGWERGTVAQNTADYAPAGYHILLGKDQSSRPVWLKDGIADSSISVYARQTAGPADSWLGVLCRVRPNLGGYGFEVTSTGRYQIAKYRFSAQATTASPLERGELSTPPLSDSPNLLRADCIGSNLSLWFNGRKVTTFKDTEYPAGGLGLIAETGASGKAGADVLFSNFVVKGP